MQILHTASFIDQPFASDAHIFSHQQLTPQSTANMLYAQQVVEAKWLGDFPTFAIEDPPEPIKHSAHLFEDVHLIYPESWNIIDKANAFLLNSKMYELCQTADKPFHHLQHSSSQELLELFNQEMFIVVCAGTA